MKHSKEHYSDWYEDNKEIIHFRGKDDAILVGANFRSKRLNNKCILFVNGRSDNIKQYSELYYDLAVEMGLDVWTLDHRGQGFSSRFTTDSYKGHVESYDDYAEDINIFYENYIKPQRYEEFYVACHSMGGTSVSLWLIDNLDIKPDAVFMTAPLFQEIAPIPDWLGRPLAWIACAFGFSKSYIPTVGKPHIGPFESNDLTADEQRYDYMCELNRLDDGTPNLVKPTNGWALASYRAMSRIRKELKKIKDLNVYLLQAEEEQYVDNEGHLRYAPDGWKLEMLRGEKHHLWHATDKGRNRLLRLIAKEMKDDN